MTCCSPLALLLLVIFTHLGWPASCQSAASPEFRLCYLPASYIAYDRVLARHARIARSWLAPQYPHVNLSLMYLQRNGNPSSSQAALAILYDSDRCHGFIGPQTSSLSLALSPVIAKPWVSHTATSTALSDKSLHPWFSRVIPTDSFAAAGMAEMIKFFGWRSAFVVCSDESYGQSVLAAFSNRFRNVAGGDIEAASCFLPDSSEPALDDLVTQVARSSSKVVVLAVPQSSPVVPVLLRKLVAAGVHTRKVLAFSESACTSYYPHLVLLPGALCVSYRIDPTSRASYNSVWASHDPAVVFHDFPSLNMPAPADPKTISALAYFIADALWLYFTALDTATTQANAVGADVEKYFAPTTFLHVIRQASQQHGFTGTLSLDPHTGDRLGARLALQNVQPQKSDQANFTLLDFATFTNATGLELLPGVDVGTLHWLASGPGAPPAADPVASTAPPAADNLPTMAVLIALLGTCLVLILLVATMLRLGVTQIDSIALLLRTGIAPRALLILGDAVLVVASAIAIANATVDVNISLEFRIAFAVLVCASILVHLAEIAVLLRLLWQFAANDGAEFDPTVAAEWRRTVAAMGAVGFAAGKLPLLVLVTILLRIAGATPARLVILILGGLLLGAVCDDIPDAITALRSDYGRLQASIIANFPVTLDSYSSARELHKVREFIAKNDAARFTQLEATARVIAVRFGSDNVRGYEFFGVVWHFMADAYCYAFGSEATASIIFNPAFLAAVETSRSVGRVSQSGRRHRRPADDDLVDFNPLDTLPSLGSSPRAGSESRRRIQFAISGSRRHSPEHAPWSDDEHDDDNALVDEQEPMPDVPQAAHVL
jgi:ABC-type branched-subunit amino acid transport system substrate-binding protein